MTKARVILVDDHPIVLAGLQELVGQLAGYEVVGTGHTANDALKLSVLTKPDLVIMDLNMNGDVIATIDEITSEDDAPAVIVFTASDQVADCNAVMSHGAKAYVVKGSSGNEIFQALDVVANGKEFISNELAARMVREMRHTPDKADPEVRLTFREEQIVRQLMAGASNKTIATHLKISEKTVKYYMSQIMQKFSVQSRLQVVVAAQSHLVS
ncbi:LuxR C-terminal-related transcriptional regulator [Roseovarius sp. MS2]|uniref:LuxR C-terminal-related transcriptional regulator n=1 Tax=Roseovarius TaxID=74030 RepID=UPI003EDBFC3F